MTINNLPHIYTLYTHFHTERQREGKGGTEGKREKERVRAVSHRANACKLFGAHVKYY